MDFRRNLSALPPLTIMNSTVTAVESFRVLGTTLAQDLKWDTYIAQQRLYFLCLLELLKQFYSPLYSMFPLQVISNLTTIYCPFIADLTYASRTHLYINLNNYMLFLVYTYIYFYF